MRPILIQFDSRKTPRHNTESLRTVSGGIIELSKFRAEVYVTCGNDVYSKVIKWKFK